MTHRLEVGSTAAAIVDVSNNSDTRIYYLAAGGAIHESGGVGPVALGASYSDQVILSSGIARVDSPIAAVTWGEGFGEIRIYYISQDNYVCELRYDRGSGFVAGDLDRRHLQTVPESHLLYAITNNRGVRVGFQSVDAPRSITEATYTAEGTWVTSQLG